MDKKYRLGKSLSDAHTDWRRIKKGLPPRYRIFFKFTSKEMLIVAVWINDQNTLRKAGAKTDCYTLFKRKLDSGEIPSDIIKITALSQKQ